MAVNLERFNKIIDISFIPKANRLTTTPAEMLKPKSIICPRHGRKPNIEINATYGASLTLENFYVTVKNLYFDLRTEQYAGVKIKAGYANNLVTIEADILNMFQQEPGPEGTTVIMCQFGRITQKWLDNTISLNFKARTRLVDVLAAIKTKLKVTDVNVGRVARGLVIETPFMYDGPVRGAFSALEWLFLNYKLSVFMQGSRLCAICTTSGDFVKSHILQFMSAPPQQNPGDEAGMWQTMITAPWMPEVQPGDRLIIPSQVYQHDFNLVGGLNKTQMLEVTKMSIHFGTTGTVNQMTCSGFIVR